MIEISKNMTSKVSRLISRLDRTEERISDLEDGSVKIIQAETHRGEKRMKGDQSTASKTDGLI